MSIILYLFVLIFIAAVAFLKQAKFGKLPSGKRLEKIKQSVNYKNGSFQNLSHTPALSEGVGFFTVLKEFLFNKNKRVKPVDTIPSIKTDLLNLDPAKDILVWFGHSSYFMQIDKKRILVDPVFSGAASPVSFNIKAFKGTDIYTADDIPEIDFLFISHDHWDHLDYKTVLQLKPKIKKIICAPGVGAHLEFWGFDKNNIIEKDWNETIDLGEGFVVNTAPGRHFSGRGFACFVYFRIRSRREGSAFLFFKDKAIFEFFSKDSSAKDERLIFLFSLAFFALSTILSSISKVNLVFIVLFYIKLRNLTYLRAVILHI